MPNPNAIFSTTIRLDPPLDRAAEELLQAERGISVELEGRRVRLDVQDGRAAGFARVLDGLRNLRLPVYVEVDPASEAITRVYVPLVGHVVNITQGQGLLDIELDTSHARHILRLGQPDSAELERLLRDALRDRGVVAVVEDDAHDIVDVRGFTPDPQGGVPPFPPLPRPEEPPSWIRRILAWIWWVICWPWWWWFGCLSTTRAQQVFNAMAATSCDPLTVPAPCIPFLYPDDGCWARAHEMCRLMINMGLAPEKVWIDHSFGHLLHVNTRNNPQCFVEWGWHVAPTLCVRGPKLFGTQRMVIDPSLFTTPVTEAGWKGVQGDPGAALTHTSADQFWHGGGPDPGYTNTNHYLAVYRLALQNRANFAGPPPYAACP